MPPRKMKSVIRELRETRGLTQEQVAKKAGVSKQYVTMLERGARRTPSLPVLQRLAKALGVPVTKLLG